MTYNGYGNKNFGSDTLGTPSGPIKWSFAKSTADSYYFPFEKAITGDLQKAVRDAFDRWASVTNLEFIEVPSTANANIILGIYGSMGSSASSTVITYSNPPKAHIYFDSELKWSNARADEPREGFPLYQAALKEIGVAVGLSLKWENGSSSVLEPTFRVNVHDISPGDIKAVQSLYGVKDSPIAPSELNDHFRSTPGDDVADGRNGFDIMKFPGSISDYEIMRSGGRIIVEGHGRDILTNVEALHFDDGVLSYDAKGIPGQVYRVYQAAFDREPDTAGLSYWIREMEGGTPLGNIAAGFLASEEASAIYGQNPSNLDFLQKVYLNVLGRPAEPAGIEYWLGRMDEGWTKGSALAAISASAENVAAVAPAIADGIWYF